MTPDPEQPAPGPGAATGNGDLPPPPPTPERTATLVPAILFLLTAATTLFAGAIMRGGSPLRDPSALWRGLPFSFTLMTILLTHEMGHYITSRRHGVRATLPYFIPAPPVPFLIGTFGAFIRMKSPILRKQPLLLIAASGPIVGFLASVVAIWVGLRWSVVVDVKPPSGFNVGAPLLLRLVSPWLVDGHGISGGILSTSVLHTVGLILPDGEGIPRLLSLHPVAFAGWIGLFVTSLNLIPIGQLDGGHVMYAIAGERQRAISIAMVAALIFLGMIGWPGWYLWAFLTAVLGLRHPPILDPERRLDRPHRLIGWATFLIFLLTFIPEPFSMR